MVTQQYSCDYIEFCCCKESSLHCPSVVIISVMDVHQVSCDLTVTHLELYFCVPLSSLCITLRYSINTNYEFLRCMSEMNFIFILIKVEPRI